MDWYNLASYATVIGETVDIDIPINTSKDSAYISFKLPVASGNSYGWEITEISMNK